MAVVTTAAMTPAASTSHAPQMCVALAPAQNSTGSTDYHTSFVMFDTCVLLFRYLAIYCHVFTPLRGTTVEPAWYYG